MEHVTGPDENIRFWQAKENLRLECVEVQAMQARHHEAQLAMERRQSGGCDSPSPVEVAAPGTPVGAVHGRAMPGTPPGMEVPQVNAPATEVDPPATVVSSLDDEVQRTQILEDHEGEMAAEQDA